MKQLGAPSSVREITVDVSDISVSLESGWRGIDSARLTALKSCFENGEYGQNLLRKPSILHFAGQNLMCQDGLLKLADGKHTVRALQELKEALEANNALEASGNGIEYSEALMSVLTDGLPVTVLEFSDWDEDVSFAWAAGVHDTDSNKFKASSLKDLVDVVHRYQKRVPGGKFKETQDLLEQVYGTSRRMFVYRMVTAAKSMSPAVLALLAKSTIPNSHINENKFFMGSGGDVGKKLTDKGKMAVIEMADSDLLEGKAISKTSFASDYCTPVRHAEVWLATKRRDFGKLAELPMFCRIEAFLFTSRARQAILNCMRSGMRLDGNSDDQPGIDQCRALVKELTLLKTKPSGSESKPSTAAAPEGDALEASSPPAGDALEASSGSGSNEVGTLVIGAEDEVDPFEEVACAKTDMALTKLSYYESGNALLKTLPTVVMPSHRLVVMIDAPTSKAQIVVKLIDSAAATVKASPCKNWKVVVSVGSRPDLFACVNSKMGQAFPKTWVVNIQLTSGDKQNKRRKPAFLVVAVPPDSLEEMPYSVPALSARAGKGEKCRFRCMSSTCSFRPQEELDALLVDNNTLESLAADCEMNRDDMEWAPEDADAIGEADGDDDDDIVMPPPEVAARSFRVDVWPFAYCKDYYKHIINGICGATVPPNHFVYFTVTAHPAALLAARDANAEVHCVLDRVKVHSKAHGQDLLRESIHDAFYVEEKSRHQPASSTRRLLSKELFFMTVEADSLQTVMFADVVHDGSTPSWRANLDQAPSSPDLEEAVATLMAKEVEPGAILVKEDGAGGRAAHAGKAFKEGDEIVAARCLLFSSAQNVAEFLNGEGNTVLLEGPLVKIANVQTPDNDTTELFAVLVGVAMFIRDFRGKKARPNAVLKFSPGKGCNDGVLSFVVATRNACGIAAGGAILADFGESFRPHVVDSVPSAAAKRFRGALDVVFHKQLETATSGEPSEEPEPSNGASGEGAGAAVGETKPAAVGETMLATTGDYEFILKDGKTLVLRAIGAGNVRISPKSVLLMLTGGSVDVEANKAVADALHAFKFTKPKDLVVNYTSKTVVTLGEVIKSSGADKMFGHAAFTKGVPPPTFAVKKEMMYHPKEAEIALTVAAKASQKLTLMWAVTCLGGKISPKGVAIVPSGQITLKSGQDFVL